MKWPKNVTVHLYDRNNYSSSKTYEIIFIMLAIERAAVVWGWNFNLAKCRRSWIDS